MAKSKQNSLLLPALALAGAGFFLVRNTNIIPSGNRIAVNRFKLKGLPNFRGFPNIRFDAQLVLVNFNASPIKVSGISAQIFYDGNPIGSVISLRGGTLQPNTTVGIDLQVNSNITNFISVGTDIYEQIQDEINLDILTNKLSVRGQIFSENIVLDFNQQLV